MQRTPALVNPIAQDTNFVDDQNDKATKDHFRKVPARSAKGHQSGNNNLVRSVHVETFDDGIFDKDVIHNIDAIIMLAGHTAVRPTPFQAQKPAELTYTAVCRAEMTEHERKKMTAACTRCMRPNLDHAQIINGLSWNKSISTTTNKRSTKTRKIQKILLLQLTPGA